MPLHKDFWQNLTKQSDDELYEMVSHAEDLLPEALHAVKAEIARRKLPAQPIHKECETCSTPAGQSSGWSITPERMILGVVGAIVQVIVMILTAFNDYGGNEVAIGFSLLIAPFAYSPALLAMYSLEVSSKRFYVILVLTLLGNFIILSTFAALVVFFWRFGESLKGSKEATLGDISASMYKKAKDEMDSGSLDEELLAKAFAIADGDKEKSFAAYVRLRAAQLHHHSRKTVLPIEEKNYATKMKEGYDTRTGRALVGLCITWVVVHKTHLFGLRESIPAVRELMQNSVQFDLPTASSGHYSNEAAVITLYVMPILPFLIVALFCYIRSRQFASKLRDMEKLDAPPVLMR